MLNYQKIIWTKITQTTNEGPDGPKIIKTKNEGI